MDGIRKWMELDRNSMLDVEAKRNADHESLCVHPKRYKGKSQKPIMALGDRIFKVT